VVDLLPWAVPERQRSESAVARAGGHILRGSSAITIKTFRRSIANMRGVMVTGVAIETLRPIRARRKGRPKTGSDYFTCLSRKARSLDW